MKIIATQVDDSLDNMHRKVDAQQDNPGFAMDAYFYRSHVAFQQEMEQVVFKSWIFAGHVSQIPGPGDYFLFEVGEDSLIITRDQQGVVRAMANVCRHRGARVAEVPTGNRKSFVCPYHGWVYNTDGSLRAARAMEYCPGFVGENLGLKQIRLEVFEGFIFINCDPDAVEFEATSLYKIQAQLGAYQLADAKIAHRLNVRVDANWKLCVENYLECYHCAPAHRSFAKMHSLKDLACKVDHLNVSLRERADRVTGIAGIAARVWEIYSTSPAFGACVSHNRYALFDGFLSGSESGKPVAPLMGNMQGYDGGVSDFQLGPLTYMLNYPDHCVLFRFVPHSITETEMEAIWFVNGDATEGVDYNVEQLTWLWQKTLLEDEYIILRNSEGVNSHFFEPGPYQPEFEEPCISFVRWYLRAMSAMR